MALRGIRLLVLTLLIGLLACTVLQALVMIPADMIKGRDDPKTAGEAVRRAICKPDDAPAEFNERETHRFKDGMLITYDARCTSASGGVSPPFPGCVRVNRLPRITLRPPDDPIWGRYFWSAQAIPPGRSEDVLLTEPYHPDDLVAFGAGRGGGADSDYKSSHKPVDS